MNPHDIRFLADESCDFALVRSLRSEGYDVVAVAEISPAISDRSVLELAIKQDRVLITEDKDFGEWVFAHKSATRGVLFFRYPSTVRSRIGEALLELVRTQGPKLARSYTVLEPGRVRIRPRADQDQQGD